MDQHQTMLLMPAWISTTGAIFKVLIMLILGVGGIFMALTGEMAYHF